MSVQDLLALFFPPIPFVFLFSFSHSFIAGIVPIMLSFSFPLPPSVSPSLPVVKQQGPCDSKLRKLPIKGNMYLTKESQEEKLVCIIAKERVIWRHLSWTGQFPVSGAGQIYPSQKKKKKKSRKREKDTPPFFSCNLLHFATMHNFAMAGQTANNKSSLNKKIQIHLHLFYCSTQVDILKQFKHINYKDI